MRSALPLAALALLSLTAAHAAAQSTPGAAPSATPARAPNGAAPPTVGPAAPGDTVWVLLNDVKPDKREQFERFLHEIFWPGTRRVAQSDSVVARMVAHTRMLHPAGPNADGTYTYAFLMDPHLGGAEYNILAMLKRAYPATEAERYRKEMFGDALARPQTRHIFVQSPD